MKPRLAVLLCVLVLSPITLLGWIAIREGGGAREMVRRQLHELSEARLRELSSRVEELLARRARELEAGPEPDSLDARGLRAWVRRLPWASQALLLGADRKLLHPALDAPISQSEREFVARAQQVFLDLDRFFLGAEDLPESSSSRDASPRTPSGQQSSRRGRSPASGWYAWFWGGDVQLLHWRRLDSGGVLGVELNRARFIADVISALPSGEDASPGADPQESDAVMRRAGPDCVRLVDSKAEPLFQWGGRDVPPGAAPDTELPLAPPLGSWRLQHFVDAEAFAESLAGREQAQLLAGLLGLAIALGALGLVVWRESSRELREARQRVSFVNRVSHELKTPLTNIRLYAELLRGEVDEEAEETPASVADVGSPPSGEPSGPGSQPVADPGSDQGRQRDYAAVIVSESERLSRLIRNVLAFGSHQREGLRVRRQPGNLDERVAATIERHRLALAARGVEARFTPGSSRQVLFDADALEQILDNLLGNVEKYAPDSGNATVATTFSGSTTRILVADHGPGIPERSREAIFEPFYRLGHELTEGASGAGLGLTIARELARLHGGDVKVVPSNEGAAFEVTLETPLAGTQPGSEAPR